MNFYRDTKIACYTIPFFKAVVDYTEFNHYVYV